MGISYNPRTVTDGLVLALDAANTKSYPGSGTTWTDLSGNNNTGTLVNGPTYSSANGGSIVLDGTNDYISCGLKGVASPSLTTETWIQKQGNSGHFLVIDNTDQPELRLTFTSTGLLILFYDNGAYFTNTTYTATFNTELWYHIATTLRNGSQNYYINGSLVLSTSGVYDGNSTTNAGEHTLGTYNRPGAGYNGYAKVKIAAHRVYNRALSAAEIQQNYNALKGRFVVPSIVTDGLVLNLDAGNTASYPGSGTTWTDISGNGNNGTLTNGPTYSSANGGSIVLDGVDDRVSFVNGTSVITTNLTIDIIIAVPNPLFSQSGFYFAGIIGLYGDNNYYRECNVQIGNTDNLPSPSTFGAVVQFLNSAGNTLNAISFGTFSFSTVPINLTYTQTGNTATTYVNGNFVATSSITKYTRPGDTNLEMGWVNNAANYGYYRGNIFSTKIYNRALSATEVSQNYEALRGRFGI
jgi:hypothetical protein